MELIAIQLARVVCFLELLSLDPKGKTNAPEGFNAMGSRYSFSKVPSAAGDLDFNKGIHFQYGRFQDVAIDQIVLYANGISIDTRSSTDDSLRVLHDILDNTKRTSGATLAPSRELLLSQILFQSDMKLSLLNPILQPLAERVSSMACSKLQVSIPFEPTAVILGPDTSLGKINPSGFSIERRAEAPFSQNSYFSTAPLSTDEHLKLLQEVEALLRPVTPPQA
jgi:hypothetical protein